MQESIHIPLNDLRSRLDELDKDKIYVPYCSIGVRGYIAARILMGNGFKAKSLAGGFKFYQSFNCKD